MQLAQFYLLHGDDGLQRLADGAGTKKSYLVQLIYNPAKNPSGLMCSAISRASGGLVSIDEVIHRTTIAEARKTLRDAGQPAASAPEAQPECEAA